MKITGRCSGKTIKQNDSMGGTGGRPFYRAIWDTSKHNIDINSPEQVKKYRPVALKSQPSMENLRLAPDFNLTAEVYSKLLFI